MTEAGTYFPSPTIFCDGAVAEIGGAKIPMYLRACGQSLSVYPVERNQIIADEIQKKLHSELDFADMGISLDIRIDIIDIRFVTNESRQILKVVEDLAHLFHCQQRRAPTP